MLFRVLDVPIVGCHDMRDQGAFALGFLLMGNLWVIAALYFGKEGFQLGYAMGLVYLFLGLFGVYKAYQK